MRRPALRRGWRREPRGSASAPAAGRVQTRDALLAVSPGAREGGTRWVQTECVPVIQAGGGTRSLPVAPVLCCVLPYVSGVRRRRDTWYRLTAGCTSFLPSAAGSELSRGAPSQRAGIGRAQQQDAVVAGRWQWLRVSERKWPSRGRPPKPHYLLAGGEWTALPRCTGWRPRGG